MRGWLVVYPRRQPAMDTFPRLIIWMIYSEMRKLKANLSTRQNGNTLLCQGARLSVLDSRVAVSQVCHTHKSTGDLIRVWLFASTQSYHINITAGFAPRMHPPKMLQVAGWSCILFFVPRDFTPFNHGASRRTLHPPPSKDGPAQYCEGLRHCPSPWVPVSSLM